MSSGIKCWDQKSNSVSKNNKNAYQNYLLVVI